MPGSTAEGYHFFGGVLGHRVPEPEQFRFELLARGLLVGRELLPRQQRRGSLDRPWRGKEPGVGAESVPGRMSSAHTDKRLNMSTRSSQRKPGFRLGTTGFRWEQVRKKPPFSAFSRLFPHLQKNAASRWDRRAPASPKLWSISENIGCRSDSVGNHSLAPSFLCYLGLPRRSFRAKRGPTPVQESGIGK